MILKIDYKTMHYKVKDYGIKIQTTAEITVGENNI